MHPAASKASPWQPPHFACPAVRMARTGKMHDGKPGFLGRFLTGNTWSFMHVFHCFPMFSSWNQIHGTRNQFQVDLEDNWAIFHHFELRLFGETAYGCQLIGDFKHQTVVLSRGLKLGPPLFSWSLPLRVPSQKTKKAGDFQQLVSSQRIFDWKKCLWWWWWWCMIDIKFN